MRCGAVRAGTAVVVAAARGASLQVLAGGHARATIGPVGARRAGSPSWQKARARARLASPTRLHRR